MRRALLFTALATSVLASSTVHAQNDRFAYAITDLSKEGAGWNALRKLTFKPVNTVTYY